MFGEIIIDVQIRREFIRVLPAVENPENFRGVRELGFAANGASLRARHG